MESTVGYGSDIGKAANAISVMEGKRSELEGALNQTKVDISVLQESMADRLQLREGERRGGARSSAARSRCPGGPEGTYSVHSGGDQCENLQHRGAQGRETG